MNMIKEDYVIKNLSAKDLPQMIKSRIAQENENGNGVTNDYIKAYEQSLYKLFKDNKIIGIGAFINNELISLGCFNLINFGHKKQIPYLCGVWTNPKYRGRGISNKINNQLFARLQNYNGKIENFALLTLEGNDAAYNLYKKLGYIEVEGEMSFLGDLAKGNQYNVKTINDDLVKEEIYSFDNENILSITFSVDQLFAHPKNLDGIVTRIININPLKENFTKEDLYYCLQTFFSNHRFCKLNINEIITNNSQIKIPLKKLLYQFKFTDVTGNVKQILSTHNVMQKDLN